MELPSGVARLVDVLAGLRGTVAVVLGGSRASGAHDTASDWDLGLYKAGLARLHARFSSVRLPS